MSLGSSGVSPCCPWAARGLPRAVRPLPPCVPHTCPPVALLHVRTCTPSARHFITRRPTRHAPRAPHVTRSDMLKLFVLLAVVVVALVSALYVVENHRIEECTDFQTLRGSWQSWGQVRRPSPHPISPPPAATFAAATTLSGSLFLRPGPLSSDQRRGGGQGTGFVTPLRTLRERIAD